MESYIIVLQILFVIASTVVGISKGRGIAGFFLGMGLSFIGVILIAILPEHPDFRAKREEEFARRIGNAVGSSDKTLHKFREEAMKRAILEDKTLLKDDPETIRRLARRTDEIVDELAVRAHRDEVQAKLEAEKAEAIRVAKEAAEADKKSALAAEELKEKARVSQELNQAREDRLNAMSPWKRFLFRYGRAITIFVALLLILVAIVSGITKSYLDAETRTQLRQDQKTYATKWRDFSHCVERLTTESKLGELTAWEDTLSPHWPPVAEDLSNDLRRVAEKHLRNLKNANAKNLKQNEVLIDQLLTSSDAYYKLLEIRFDHFRDTTYYRKMKFFSDSDWDTDEEFWALREKESAVAYQYYYIEDGTAEFKQSFKIWQKVDENRKNLMALCKALKPDGEYPTGK